MKMDGYGGGLRPPSRTGLSQLISNSKREYSLHTVFDVVEANTFYDWHIFRLQDSQQF
jgi:hypothetical protein